MGEYQEEVLINILDLQAELRGDEPEPADADEKGEPEASTDAEPAAREETLAVTDGGLTVSVPGPVDETAAHERLAAMSSRLAKLESYLARVTERIERIQPVPEMHAHPLARERRRGGLRVVPRPAEDRRGPTRLGLRSGPPVYGPAPRSRHGTP